MASNNLNDYIKAALAQDGTVDITGLMQVVQNEINNLATGEFLTITTNAKLSDLDTGQNYRVIKESNGNIPSLDVSVDVPSSPTDQLYLVRIDTPSQGATRGNIRIVFGSGFSYHPGTNQVNTLTSTATEALIGFTHGKWVLLQYNAQQRSPDVVFLEWIDKTFGGRGGGTSNDYGGRPLKNIGKATATTDAVRRDQVLVVDSSGDLDGNNKKAKNFATDTSSKSLVTNERLAAQTLGYDGSKFSALKGGARKTIENVGDPSGNYDATTKKFVDDNFALKNDAVTYDNTKGAFSAKRRGADTKVTDVATPTANSDATTKNYVDTKVGLKADTTYVDTELGKKADTTYVDTELGKKVDKAQYPLTYNSGNKLLTITDASVDKVDVNAAMTGIESTPNDGSSPLTFAYWNANSKTTHAREGHMIFANPRNLNQVQYMTYTGTDGTMNKASYITVKKGNTTLTSLEIDPNTDKSLYIDFDAASKGTTEIHLPLNTIVKDREFMYDAAPTNIRQRIYRMTNAGHVLLHRRSDGMFILLSLSISDGLTDIQIAELTRKVTDHNFKEWKAAYYDQPKDVQTFSSRKGGQFGWKRTYTNLKIDHLLPTSVDEECGESVSRYLNDQPENATYQHPTLHDFHEVLLVGRTSTSAGDDILGRTFNTHDLEIDTGNMDQYITFVLYFFIPPDEKAVPDGSGSLPLSFLSGVNPFSLKAGKTLLPLSYEIMPMEGRWIEVHAYVKRESMALNRTPFTLRIRTKRGSNFTQFPGGKKEYGFLMSDVFGIQSNTQFYRHPIQWKKSEWRTLKVFDKISVTENSKEGSPTGARILKNSNLRVASLDGYGKFWIEIRTEFSQGLDFNYAADLTKRIKWSFPDKDPKEIRLGGALEQKSTLGGIRASLRYTLSQAKTSITLPSGLTSYQPTGQSGRLFAWGGVNGLGGGNVGNVDTTSLTGAVIIQPSRIWPMIDSLVQELKQHSVYHGESMVEAFFLKIESLDYSQRPRNNRSRYFYEMANQLQDMTEPTRKPNADRMIVGVSLEPANMMAYSSGSARIGTEELVGADYAIEWGGSNSIYWGLTDTILFGISDVGTDINQAYYADTHSVVSQVQPYAPPSWYDPSFLKVEREEIQVKNGYGTYLTNDFATFNDNAYPNLMRQGVTVGSINNDGSVNPTLPGNNRPGGFNIQGISHVGQVNIDGSWQNNVTHYFVSTPEKIRDAADRVFQQAAFIGSKKAALDAWKKANLTGDVLIESTRSTAQEAVIDGGTHKKTGNYDRRFYVADTGSYVITWHGHYYTGSPPDGDAIEIDKLPLFVMPPFDIVISLNGVIRSGTKSILKMYKK